MILNFINFFLIIKFPIDFFVGILLTNRYFLQINLHFILIFLFASLILDYFNVNFYSFIVIIKNWLSILQKLLPFVAFTLKAGFFIY